MELALFPIAAILLLLSGASAPAHLASRQGTTAALREIFAGTGLVSRGAAQSAAAFAGTGIAVARHGSVPVPRVSLLGRRKAPSQLRCGTPRALDRKQYRTRFGFAEGAYLAVGPPASSGFRLDCHWS